MTTLEGFRGNLNMCFSGVDGESLMMSMGNLAVSSGSACTSSDPEPSHVLRALGLDDDATRSSLRFSLGRFNTVEEVEFAVGGSVGRRPSITGPERLTGRAGAIVLVVRGR